MKRFMTAVATVTTLWLVQSCSLSPNAEEQLTATAIEQHNDEHAVNAGSHNTHSADSAGNETIDEFAQAKLTVPNTIAFNTLTPLTINIQDATGEAIKDFETFQDMQMHLILVSDDLQVFSHLHPTYQENGRFTVETRFPQSGGYTLFSDYKPAGQAEQVSVMKVQVPGNRPLTPPANLSRTKTVANTKVDFNVSQETIKAGEEVTLTFDLQDAATNQPVTNLQPYLGEGGHLVILQQSSSLTKEDYVHAHAMDGTSPGQVQFITRFPRAGMYKLWGQFNRNGEVITSDFWVEVS
ncbi:hypothetical protein [Gloeocapsopsis dulcis]|uniref:YtkA-like domain-containing protein n=1 Tax=Gloeocapsopsis dulcis AAB1 = 1H9 TaxID=1433147 RepID=A0A6N8FYD9_9CHRO|nr:hypothetical protein [Gloeocapsopsis dulcis]MUL37147.1 hypothetical protein [Gloeocapsopsis dulcis AAB1 = 1H9]WNN88431.1 hypothetical protein P0S91_19400 [Gloeocapsopsis dulcis]